MRQHFSAPAPKQNRQVLRLLFHRLCNRGPGYTLVTYTRCSYSHTPYHSFRSGGWVGELPMDPGRQKVGLGTKLLTSMVQYISSLHSDNPYHNNCMYVHKFSTQSAAECLDTHPRA